MPQKKRPASGTAQAWREDFTGASVQASRENFTGLSALARREDFTGLAEVRAAKAEYSTRWLQSSRVAAAQGLRRLNAAPSPAPADNVVGVGIGEKEVDGKLTGVAPVKLLVQIKLPPSQLASTEFLPKTIGGLPTDVEQIGLIRRLSPRRPRSVVSTVTGAAAPAPALDPRARLRPAQPGCSVGFADPNNQFMMAGTLGALVQDANGLYILSNNHVLADEDRLTPGTPIYQPGLLDGGDTARDQLAQLTRAIRLDLAAPNQVDCAIAAVLQRSDVSNSILFIGPVAGVAPATIDMVVHKFGRTTSYTAGRISSIDTDTQVKYDTGTCVFSGQIIIKGINNSPFSAAGDSGSLIVERETQKAVGLLFAGSPTHTIANHIQDVLGALKVTLV